MEDTRRRDDLNRAGVRTEVGTLQRVRADLHVHTRFSGDGVMSVSQLVTIALRRGLTCLAITDHNAVDGALEALDSGALQIIVGEEVRTAEGEITGLFLKEAVPGGLTALETVQRIKEQGGLVYVPHPFDRLRGSVLLPRALQEVLPYVDIIEVYNSRNILPQDNSRALVFAREHGLAPAGGSDAHIPYEVGRTVVEMPAFHGPQEFLHSLREGAIIGRRSPAAVHVASGWAKLWRGFRR